MSQEYRINGLTPGAQERIRDKIRQHYSYYMTAKKRHKLGIGKVQLPMSGMGSLGTEVTGAGTNAVSAKFARLAPPTEIYNRSPYPGGFPSSAAKIPREIRFVPRAGSKLVDIPLDLTEQVKQEIVEAHGVPADQAQLLASNAVDRWMEQAVPRQPMSVAEAMITAGSFVPKFSIESLPGALGELPAATEQITRDYAKAGWKTLIPLALGAGLVVLWLKRK